MRGGSHMGGGGGRHIITGIGSAMERNMSKCDETENNGISNEKSELLKRCRNDVDVAEMSMSAALLRRKNCGAEIDIDIVSTSFREIISHWVPL